MTYLFLPATVASLGLRIRPAAIRPGRWLQVSGGKDGMVYI